MTNHLKKKELVDKPSRLTRAVGTLQHDIVVRWSIHDAALTAKDVVQAANLLVQAAVNAVEGCKLTAQAQISKMSDDDLAVTALPSQPMKFASQ